MKLLGHTILVTGATRGIGSRFARLVGARGTKVLLVGRDEQRLRGQARFIGENATPMTCDLSDPAALSGLIERIEQDHPRLSVIVNNAALQQEMNFIHGDRTALMTGLQNEIATNLLAPMVLTTRLLPVLLRQPESAVLNVTSALVLSPKAAAPVYCASKAALSGFSAALAMQCAAEAPHLRIIEAVMPLVETDMTRGRGRGKISAEKAALGLLAAIEAERPRYWIGKSRFLPIINRISPALVQRILS